MKQIFKAGHRGWRDGWCVRTGLAALAVAFAGATSVGAQQPPDPHAVQPERPSVATHAGTVAPGWVEVEGGVERDRFDDASHGLQTSFVAKVGLASHLQLNVQVPVVAPPGGGATGMGDTLIGVKWRVRDDAPILGDVAILPALKIDSGTPETGTGTTDVGLLFISSHRFGSVGMDINAGYTRRSGDGSGAPRNATLWAVAFGGPAAGPVGWAAEVSGQPATSGPAGADSTVAFLVGPTLTIRPWLAIDAGVILPLAGPQPRAIYAGAVYNIGSLVRRP